MQGVRGRHRARRSEGGRGVDGGQRKGSQEKGEVADLELPRSSGRLHPASSCARREKSAVRCSPRPSAGARARRSGVSRNPLNSYVTRTRRASKDADFDRRWAGCRLAATATDPTPRNSRNRIPVARPVAKFSRQFRRKLKLSSRTVPSRFFLFSLPAFITE